ncbi:MAG TPA: hypothetical protein VNZ26_27035, partial [Vicinamibacterales bacterium]|nr:hypothetical protein [Vicinamibacterales bacterium]
MAHVRFQGNVVSSRSTARILLATLVSSVCWAGTLCLVVLRAQTPQPTPDMAHPQGTNAGIFAFTGHCAGCHDTGKN